MVTSLLILVIVFGCAQTLSLKYFKIDNLKSRMFVYVFFLALTAIICSLPLLFSESVYISLATVAIGVFFGFVFVMCILFYNLAIENGPLYLSSFYFSASMLIPTAAGIIFWNEKTSLATYISLIMFVLAFYLINAKSSKTDKKLNVKWIVFCLLTFLSNGMLGTAMKLNAELSNGEGSTEFVAISFSFATLFCIILYLFLYIKDKHRSMAADVHCIKQNTLPIFTSAISSSVLNLLISYLAGIIPSSYLQPITQGGIIISITLFSLIVFKEKLSKTNVAGLVFGISAIILINI